LTFLYLPKNHHSEGFEFSLFQTMIKEGFKKEILILALLILGMILSARYCPLAYLTDRFIL